MGRFDVPVDASPKYRELCLRIKRGIEKHGSHNSYYLHNAKCAYHLLNHDVLGLLELKFEGVLLTRADDTRTERSDLQVELVRETCEWLTEPVVQWFVETVPHSVEAEFDRYIQAGDLALAKRRVEQIQADSDEAGGYLGMYL